MRYDLPNFRIDFRDWMKGNNLYDNYPTGGLKATAAGYNPFKYPGLLVAQPTRSETAITSGLARYPVIAWSAGSQDGYIDLTVVGRDADPNTLGNGVPYRVNGRTGAFIKAGGVFPAQTPSDILTSHGYRLGYSEMVESTSAAFISSDLDVAEIDPGELNTVNYSTADEDWFSSLSGGTLLRAGSPHPLAWFGEDLYVGDQFELHQATGFGTTIVANQAVITLPSRYTITSLEEHKGYLYITATKFYELSNNFTGSLVQEQTKIKTEVFIWDGFSESFLENYPLPDQVTAMKTDEDGRLYMWTTKQFGYFNGLAFVPLKDLENIVYRPHICKVKNGLMYADGMKAIRYGSIVPGGERKFYLHETFTKNISALMCIIPDIMIVALDGGSGNAGINILYSSIDSGTPGTTRSLDFNPRFTKVAVKVRHVVVETADGLGASGVVTVKHNDANGVSKTDGTFTYTNAKMAAKRRWVFDVFDCDPTSEIQPVIEVAGSVKLKSVDYYYEQATDTNNS